MTDRNGGFRSPLGAWLQDPLVGWMWGPELETVAEVQRAINESALLLTSLTSSDI